jgi:hypothetical protein
MLKVLMKALEPLWKVKMMVKPLLLRTLLQRFLVESMLV